MARKRKNNTENKELYTKENRPYASYPEGYNKLLNKIMPFWARPMKKMMGDLFIRVLMDG